MTSRGKASQRVEKFSGTAVVGVLPVTVMSSRSKKL